MQEEDENGMVTTQKLLDPDVAESLRAVPLTDLHK
jgi:hypothetical protein